MENQNEVVSLSHDQIENIVRRSYQYVALYNVNNKFALVQGGWNTVVPDTQLKDHTMREIARPNNDTLYIGCMLDLRNDAVILEMPAFESDYVSLMVTAYDHYVNVPMSTQQGDFRKPEKMVFYSARTKGYNGENIEGVDRTFEASGDFISAILRIMPHANDPDRFQRIVKQMQSVKIVTLSEYRGGKAKPINDITFPQIGKTDFDVFENNLLEVMQYVFNHTTFDPENEDDNGVLTAYKPLGLEPGREYDAEAAKKIDGKQFRSVAEEVFSKNMALMEQPEVISKIQQYWMKPKGKTNLDTLVAASVIGPIGLPASEAVYPPVNTTDGKRMNAMNDYVIRMSKEELPPCKAFWSLTLYDHKNGFFIPNEQKKYSVGENGGMKLNSEGGIEIYIAAEKPEGVPLENWLPINREDVDLSANMRVYVPDFEKMKTWKAPSAEPVK